MKLKTFSGTGYAGIQEVENSVNTWLAEQGADIEVADHQTAMCTIADSGDGERYQAVLITIWYTERGFAKAD
jgi:hypothetical protein